MGCDEGNSVGTAVGCDEGSKSTVLCLVGRAVGRLLGKLEGFDVGPAVG